MQKFKQINSSTIALAGKVYKGYPVGDLLKTFGFIYNVDKDQIGIAEWFNYNGLTYIAK